MNGHVISRFPKAARLACAVLLAGFVAFAWGAFEAQPAAADDGSQASQQASESSELQTVRVGYYESRDFQEGMSDDEPKSGYGYEYLQRIASYAGWRYEYVYGTWNELYQKLCDGEIDMLAGVSKSDERAGLMKFPSASMLSQTFYIYADAAASEKDASDGWAFAGARIGVVAKSNSVESFDAWLDETSCGAKPVEFDSFEEMRDAFEAGNIDAFVSSDNVAHDLDDAAPVQIIGKMPYYLAVSNSRGDLLMQLNETLGIMNSQDAAFLDELQSRYAADSSVNVYVTAEEKHWMQQHSTLVVGYLNNYLPFSDTESDGEATGLFTDVLAELLDKLPGNWEPEIEAHGFDSQIDLIAALKNGEIDLAFPVGGGSWYAEENGFLLSTPVVSPSMSLVLSSKFNMEAQQPATLAVNSHNLLQRLYTEKYFPDATIVECDSVDGCLAAIATGKADGTVLNGLRTSALLSSRQNIVSVQLPEGDDMCFGVAQTDGAFLQLINRGLGIIGEQFGTDASYKYTAGLFKYTFADFVRDNWVVFATLGVLILVAFVLFMLRHYRKLRFENEREVEQNRKLEEALQQAEQASHAKDELLTNLSHDIRTPLNGILGMMDINGTCDDPAVIAANTEKARAAARQLLNLVDDLLEMSKLKGGSLEIGSEPFELAQVIDDVLLETRARAAEKHINVMYAGHSAALAACRVCGSPAYVRQVLLNVADNAVRYNVEGGRVTLQADVSQHDGKALLRCSVSDTGIGMGEDDLARVFEPFAQSADAARSVYPGSGLGMPIVKSLVELMGGTVEVSSRLGQGTLVEIGIPFEVASSDDAAPAEAPSIDGMRVMVVEDNDLNLEIAKSVVERAGAKVAAVARDGRQAVETFAASPDGAIEAILMDIMMPVMDGYEAAREIRSLSREDAGTVAIVAVTAKVFESDRAEAFAAGMNDHLPKPLDPAKLVEVLSKYRIS